eukprot:TRINITY_DN56700_c0_g1_i1.p1 TRINITY_DN56700_c0_g1~~TRINITY_DN56700_c0_g1_i1.p1  ORF type:complete len:602 (-),score=48.59 TRINITY_DN56700_c0_g1_i1:149-1954(-)
MRQSLCFFICGRLCLTILGVWTSLSFVLMLDPSYRDFPQLATNDYVCGLSPKGFVLNASVVATKAALPPPCEIILRTDTATALTATACHAWCVGAVGDRVNLPCAILDSMNPVISEELQSRISGNISFKTGTGVFDSCAKAKVALSVKGWPSYPIAFLALAASVALAVYFPTKMKHVGGAVEVVRPSSTECTASLLHLPFKSDADIARARLILGWCSACATVGGNVLAIFAALQLGQPIYAVLLFFFTYSAPLGIFQRRYFTALINSWQLGFRGTEYYEVQALCSTSNAFALALKTFILLRSHVMTTSNLFIFFGLGVCMKAFVSNPDVVLAHHVLPTRFQYQMIALAKVRELAEKSDFASSFLGQFGKEMLQAMENHMDKLNKHNALQQGALALLSAVDTSEVIKAYGHDNYYSMAERKHAVSSFDRLGTLLWPLTFAVTLGSANMFGMSYNAFFAAYASIILVCAVVQFCQGRFEHMKQLAFWPLLVFYSPFPNADCLHTVRVSTITSYWCFWFWTFEKSLPSFHLSSLLSLVQYALLFVGVVGSFADVLFYVGIVRKEGVGQSLKYKPLSAVFVYEYLFSQGPYDLEWLSEMWQKRFG